MNAEVSGVRESRLRFGPKQLAAPREACELGFPLCRLDTVTAARSSGVPAAPHTLSTKAERVLRLPLRATQASRESGTKLPHSKSVGPEPSAVHVHIGWFVFFNLFEGVSNEAGVNVIDSQHSGLGQVAPCQGVVIGGQDWIATLKTVEECG